MEVKDQFYKLYKKQSKDGYNLNETNENLEYNEDVKTEDVLKFYKNFIKYSLILFYLEYCAGKFD